MIWFMSKSIWDKENLQELAGKKGQSKYFNPINLSLICIMIFNIIINQLMLGSKESAKVIVKSIYGLMIELMNG